MNKLPLLFCVIITCGLFSCKKKKTDPQPITTATDVRDTYKGTFDLIATNTYISHPSSGPADTITAMQAYSVAVSYSTIDSIKIIGINSKQTLPAITFIDKAGKKQLYGIDAGSKLFAPDVRADLNSGGFVSKDSINYTYSDAGVSFTSTTVVTGHRQ